ncbi:MAG: ornithine cyclodeaminase family protein [Desulfamplus sp.]|nr:ornithine cyclodeaminase family protein [Desulfamplus sp.]
MLFLNATDIESCLVRNELMDQMEEAMSLFETQEVNMPPRTHLSHDKNTLLLMPCFGQEYFSTKLVSVFPGNQGTANPVVNGIVVLNDAKTGVPVAVLDGQTLTAIRTGAVGGLGTRYFASLSSNTAGLVGSGVQGFHQLLFAATAHIETTGHPLKTIYIYNRDASKVPDFIALLRPQLEGTELRHAATVEELLEESDTVILATSSAKPVLPDEPSLLDGKCIVAIGSYTPDMQEIPKSAFMLADAIFMDTSHAIHESGDLINPLKHGWISPEKLTSLGQFLLELKKTKSKDASKFSKNHGDYGASDYMRGRTVIYKSVGMAVFDLMAAIHIFKCAIKDNVGTKL